SRLTLREQLDVAPAALRVRGIEGDSGRLTGAAEWKKNIVTDEGLVITPLLAFQADVNYANASTRSLSGIDSMAANTDILGAYPGVANGFLTSYARYVATLVL